jgi:leucine dehydrogenase
MKGMDSQGLNHEQVVVRRDDETGLVGIIALHSTRLGPAAGGCRRWRYVDDNAARMDALRLSEGMTLKNALAGIPFGGGKSVIVADHHDRPTQAQLHRFAEWLNEFQGRYIAAEDVGMGVAEIRTMAAVSPYVSGLGREGIGGDPSPKTAYGVYLGLKTAVQYKLGVEHLHDIRVGVQGLGSVGMALCHWLARAGAKIWATDLDPSRIREAEQKYNAVGVAPEQILNLDLDVFAPCAMGGVITTEVAAELNTAVIAGAANNQLACAESGQILADRSILYAPDFVVNAGGVISVAHEYLLHQGRFADDPEHNAELWVSQRLDGIPHRLINILQSAEVEQVSTDTVARAKAMDIVTRGGCDAAIAA